MAYITAWFKVIKEDKLLGVVTEQSFARYSGKRIHICKAIAGQYLVLNDKFYRDDWMLPLDPASPVEYENVMVISIPEKEYDILNKLNVAEPVSIEDLYLDTEPEEVLEKAPKIEEVATVEYVRERKLKELSAECRQSIESGFSLVLSDEASHHFSMTTQDQINLIGLQQALTDGDDMIYHADGELEQFYSEEDAKLVLAGAKKWKNYNLVLYNSLKNWINSMTDISAIEAVTYDSEIPDEYCTAVLEHLTENF